MAAILEWADADPRLDLREGYIPGPGDEAGILTDVAARLSRLQTLLTAAASTRRIVLTLPSAALPPWLPALAGQASIFKLKLRVLLSSFAAECATAGIRIGEIAYGSSGYDIRTHLNSGFPYTISYGDILAATIATLLLPPAPAKGLVTDLDNTLWSGIVGDDGPANVHWSLEKHTRIHGIYQQFLAGLAAQGVLLAAVSKNDPAPVAEVLSREDLLLPPEAFFPIETNWSAKSNSIRRIAHAWNIGLDSIVFVDDNPLELAEVSQLLPEVECHVFRSDDPAAVMELMEKLRLRFAREHTTEEDRLRAASLRSGAQLAEVSRSTSDSEELLMGLDARITLCFSRDPFDPRTLELLNKTNQFNLNGRRWEEGQLRAFLARPDAVFAVVTYQDRFGKLGKIAVASGILHGGCLQLESWVMSCRAFSRRIEFNTLHGLFDQTGVCSIQFDWKSTLRNNPTRETLKILCGDIPDGGMLSLSSKEFATNCPPLFAAVFYE
jgi:FkbH-like protein